MHWLLPAGRLLPISGAIKGALLCAPASVHTSSSAPCLQPELAMECDLSSREKIKASVSGSSGRVLELKSPSPLSSLDSAGRGELNLLSPMLQRAAPNTHWLPSRKRQASIRRVISWDFAGWAIWNLWSWLVLSLYLVLTSSICQISMDTDHCYIRRQGHTVCTRQIARSSCDSVAHL